MNAKQKLFLIVLLIAIMSIIIGCSQKQSSDNFDSTSFKQSPGAITLCFDLRNDANPKTGLLLKIPSKTLNESHTLALPFGSTNISTRKEIYSTWGSYDSTTLVRFYSLSNIGGNYEISVSPNFGATPSQWNDDIRDLPSSSLFLLKYGLTRHFIYKYPDADPNKKQWLQEIGQINDTNIDFVAVALPSDSTGKEIKRTNQTSIPQPMVLEEIKFFPATSKSDGINAIYVKYEIPPNKEQQVLIEQGVKGVISIIPIFVQLIIFLYIKPKNRSRAKIFIWIFAFIQLLIILWLFYSSFSLWQESTIKSITDLIFALITGALSGILLYKEKQNDSVS